MVYGAAAILLVGSLLLYVTPLRKNTISYFPPREVPLFQPSPTSISIREQLSELHAQPPQLDIEVKPQPQPQQENVMKETTLETIADGAAVELFQHELKRVAKNIADPNTKSTAKRKLTLTFEFAPDDTRDEVHVHVSAKATLANTKGYTKTIYTGKRNGEVTLYGADQKQTDLFDQGVEQIKPTEVKNA